MATAGPIILVSGMVAGDPHQGGATWAVLQYLLGLARLGFDAYLVEPVRPESLRPAGAPLAASINAAYFRQVVAEFGLQERAALLLQGSRETVGLPYESLPALARRAEALFNISGMLTDEALLAPIPVRVYLDLDPAFIQLWHAVQGIDMRFAGHTHFVTVGLALGRPDCPVPTCGREWIGTLPPVVLEHWPFADTLVYDGLTTVGNWRGYGSIEYQGTFYGQKAHSMRLLLALPARTPRRCMPAFAIHPGERRDLESLRGNGWHLLDPAVVAGTPRSYQQLVASSWAELGVVKSGYVASRCAWFSDRSVCYLASGRPVLFQETGISHFLPTGEGLFVFQTAEDVLAALEDLERDYPRQRRAARALAEDLFSSDRVLGRLLARIGVSP